MQDAVLWALGFVLGALRGMWMCRWVLAAMAGIFLLACLAGRFIEGNTYDGYAPSPDEEN